MTTRVFITGMARSGTTLLDKLLASHPDATILSQPFPLLFVGAKSAFLKVRAALPKIYPLNSLFLETDYTYEDFSHFLSRFDFSRAELVNLFGEMKSYQGQYTKTPDIDSAIAEFRSYRFAELFAQLQYHFRRRSAPTVCGSKETYCEEFVPFLVQSGWKCIIMVRDPRDTVVSLNYGHFERFLGKRRPILWDLRQWRKSIAFALMMQNHPQVKIIRYERLAADPKSILRQLEAFLELPPFADEVIAHGLLDESGSRWEGNSSHSSELDGANRKRISTASVDKYKTILSEEVIGYIEAVCYPEMRAMDYQTILPYDRQRISRFKEPFAAEREEFAEYYTEPEIRAEEELARLVLLSGSLIGKELQFSNFINPAAYMVLRGVCSGVA